MTRRLNKSSCLFRPGHLFSIVHLSRVEQQVVQVAVPVFMSSIPWLEANTFINVYRLTLHSLTKRTHYAEEYNRRDKYTKTINCSNIQKENTHIKRDSFSLMYGTILTFIKFNNFGTRCLNRPKHLFHLFCYTTQCIFEPCMYMSLALIQINTVCFLSIIQLLNILYSGMNTDITDMPPCQIYNKFLTTEHTNIPQVDS